MRSAVRFPLALTVGLALLASRLFSFETENHNAVAYRISQPVVINGELDESAWREASPVSSFTQREPREGEPASELTQVKVLFDDHSLYIGITCHDREPSKVVANEMRRDAVLEDDGFFEKSSFGGIALSKDPFVENGKDYNHGAGLDFSLAFGQNFQAGGFVAKTFTPSSRGKDWAGYLSLIWSSDFFSSDISYTDIGKNFNAEMGFVPRLDMKRLRLNVGIGPRPKILNIRPMLLFNYFNYVENHSGLLETRFNFTGMRNTFQDGGELFFAFIQNYEFLTKPFEIKEKVFIPSGKHHFNVFVVSYESNKSKNVSWQVKTRSGQFYNGHFLTLELGGVLKLSQHLNMECIYNRNQFDLPLEGGKFVSNIAGSRIIYSFTPRLFAKVYLQWNDTEKRFKSNFLIRWIYKPGSNLYLIYNETRDLGGQELLGDRVLMLKVSFLFNT